MNIPSALEAEKPPYRLVLKIFWVAIWLSDVCSNQIWARHIIACRKTVLLALGLHGSSKKRKTHKAPKATGGVCSHSCVALSPGCVSCCEVTGSVIGPRGFYLAVLTGHVSDFLFFSSPFSFKSTWPHWPFSAHYQYFYKSVSTVMKVMKKKKVLCLFFFFL